MLREETEIMSGHILLVNIKKKVYMNVGPKMLCFRVVQKFKRLLHKQKFLAILEFSEHKS